ncbi:MAG TPA: ferredoxin [Jatrophihabitans sp.]|nr:ferredoxin [Jatrophihabitans sp.]
MPLVKADAGLCQGYANCVMDAGEVFDLDDEGLVVVLRPVISEDERSEVEQAVVNCPVAALALVEE